MPSCRSCRPTLSLCPGSVAAGDPSHLEERHLPGLSGDRAAAKPTPWTALWSRLGTFCATPRPQYAGGILMKPARRFTGRPVRRRQRARDQAPDLLAVFTKMLSGLGRAAQDLARTVCAAADAGHGAQRCLSLRRARLPVSRKKCRTAPKVRQRMQYLRQMKMSKTFRNVVEPMALVENTVPTPRGCSVCLPRRPTRCSRNEAGVEGCSRFLGRMYRLVQRFVSLPEGRHPTHRQCSGGPAADDATRPSAASPPTSSSGSSLTPRLPPSWSCRTPSPTLLQPRRPGRQRRAKSVETAVQLLGPMAPHICEELWHALGHKALLALSAPAGVRRSRGQRRQSHGGRPVNGKNALSCKWPPIPART